MTRLLRRAALLFGALLLVACLAVIAVSVLGPRLLRDRVEQAAESLGASVVLGDLTLHRDGSAHLATLSFDRDGLGLVCSDLRARTRWRELARRRAPLARLEIARCDVRLAPRDAASATPTSAGERQPVLDRVDAALERLDDRVASLRVDRVTLDAPAHGANLEARDVVWDRGVISTRVEARRGPLRASTTVDYRAGDPEARTGEIVARGPGIRAGADSAALTREGLLTIERPRARGLFGPGVDVERIALHRPDEGPPLVDVYGVSVELERDVRRLPAEQDESDPAAWIPRVHDRLTAAGRDLERAGRWLDRVPDLPVVARVHGTLSGVGDAPVPVLVTWGRPPADAVQPDSPPEGGARVTIWRDPSGQHVELRGWPLQRGEPGDLLQLGGRARFTWRDDGVTVSGSLDPLTLHHEAIAGDTVELGPLAYTALVRLTESATSIEASGRWNGLPWAASLVADDATRRLELALEASEAWDCAQTWAAVPDALIPALGRDAIELSGELSPHVRVTLPVESPGDATLDVRGVPGGCEIERILPAWDPARLLRPDWTTRPSEGVEGSAPTLGPGSSNYVPLDTLPPYIPALMYLSEEVNFPTNPGVALGLIERGLQTNLVEGRYVYGGSSVSQQLIKNLFLRREKSVARKFEELVLTWALERVVPKWRILELYYNCIEFGPDVWGLSAAAEYYFGRAPSTLTPLEAAFLATLKPAPSEGATYRRRGRSNTRGWWPGRLELLLRRLVEHGQLISDKEVEVYAPYVVALRRNDAPATEDGAPLLGDGEVVRIERPDWVIPFEGRPPWGEPPTAP